MLDLITNFNILMTWLVLGHIDAPIVDVSKVVRILLIQYLGKHIHSIGLVAKQLIKTIDTNFVAGIILLDNTLNKKNAVYIHFRAKKVIISVNKRYDCICTFKQYLYIKLKQNKVSNEAEDNLVI